MNEDLSVTINPQQYNDCTVRQIPTPTAAAGAGAIDLSWTAATTDTSETPQGNNITEYNIYRSTNQATGFTQIGSATGTSYSDSTGATGTTYYYAIEPIFRGSVALGIYSANSNGVQFPAGGNNPPNAFTLIAPADAATDVAVRPAFSWNASIDPDGDTVTYTLVVSPNADLSAPVIDQSGLSATTYTPTADLLNDTLYYWSVTASDGNGGATSSATWSFTTIAGGGGADFTVAPTSAYIGQTIVLSGTGFGAAPGTITFDTTITGNPTAWSDTSITVAVPDGVTLGSIDVGLQTGSVGIITGGVVIDDVEGGSVGTWDPALVQSGYYVFEQFPDSPLSTSYPDRARIDTNGNNSMQILYSYRSRRTELNAAPTDVEDWGGGWGGTLANTLDLDSYNDISFYVQWDGSSNSMELSFTDAGGNTAAAPIDTSSLSTTAWTQVNLTKTDFTEDAGFAWGNVTGYNFIFTQGVANINYHYINNLTAGTADVPPGDNPGGTTTTGEVVVTQVDPAIGPAGTEFTAIGSGFGDTQGISFLAFENNSTGVPYVVEITFWSDTSIEAIVPRLAPAGDYTLKVIKRSIAADNTVQAFESNPSAFQVTATATPGIATVYPNPFNPLSTQQIGGLDVNAATIAYDATGITTIGIYIYDTTARLVYRSVVSGNQISWDGRDTGGSYVADGVYLLRVVNEETKSLIARSKILVIKQ